MFAFTLLNQWQTALIILVNRDAIEALKTLAILNLARGRDRLIFAAVAA
jgi:hypothetical protein